MTPLGGQVGITFDFCIDSKMCRNIAPKCRSAKVIVEPEKHPTFVLTKKPRSRSEPMFHAAFQCSFRCSRTLWIILGASHRTGISGQIRPQIDRRLPRKAAEGLEHFDNVKARRTANSQDNAEWHGYVFVSYLTTWKGGQMQSVSADKRR